MSVLGKIMSAVLGSHVEAAPAAGGTATTGAPAHSTSTAPAASTSAASAPASATPAPASATPVAPPQNVDVAAILDKAVAAHHEKLEWRTSIVDMMKALDIDASLAARKQLAKELGYTGDHNDSASMNVWLHKQVMAKLAANGGKLPPEIKH